MTLSEFQEEVIKLFLRLNGYVTSGLLIHSDKKGKVKTQIDLVAIRFPYHSQEDRIVTSCNYLQIPANNIDIIVGEVKGGNEKNQFNPALRNDVDAIQKLIKWIGFVDQNRINGIANWLTAELQPKEINVLGDFPKFEIDNFSLRPIVFNLDDSAPRPNQKRIVYGDLMISYIWDCFRPDNERATCSTTYPLNLWGHSLTPIVEYFKNPNKADPGTVEDLYRHFNFI